MARLPEHVAERFWAYALLRVALGTNFAFHSYQRWLHLSAFAEKMVADFAITPLPAIMVNYFAYSVAVVEPIIGLLLMLGIFTRFALLAAGLLLIALTFGTSLRADFPVLGIQLLYSLVISVLLFFIRYNVLSLDKVRERDRF